MLNNFNNEINDLKSNCLADEEINMKMQRLIISKKMLH